MYDYQIINNETVGIKSMREWIAGAYKILVRKTDRKRQLIRSMCRW